MKRTSNKISRSDDLSWSPLSRVGWLSLILSLATKATAFHSSPREPVAMLGSRGAVRDTSTEFYGRQKFPRKSSTSTRLQYRDGNEDPTTPSLISSKWWAGLFSSSTDSVNEQDSVDEYLEFLDRRYHRLHEEKEPKSFSAINWLLQGSEKDSEVIASHQQKDDALYVLGVAGLASHKLLQKHPQLTSENGEGSTSTMREATSVPIETLDAFATSGDENTFGNMVIKKVLVPFVKFLYWSHRKREMFLNMQTERARHLVTKAARSVVRTILYGPINAAKVMLEIGGGKRNIVSTLALASTLFVLTRPVFQAIVTEGSVSP